jgi:hypothetical protein
VGFLEGSGFCAWNLDTDEKEYIWSERYGFSHFEINMKQRVIVLVEYGMNPSIYIFDSDLQPQLKITGTQPP